MYKVSSLSGAFRRTIFVLRSKVGGVQTQNLGSLKIGKNLSAESPMSWSHITVHLWVFSGKTEMPPLKRTILLKYEKPDFGLRALKLLKVFMKVENIYSNKYKIRTDF
jgi:hypothetical protein